MKTRKGVPVVIYKNNKLLEEFPTIQEAAHFMKDELGRGLIPWTIINKGIHENKSYIHINGVIYSFEKFSDISTKNFKAQATINTPSKIKYCRSDFIEFISKHLEECIHLKLQISDQRLRQYHLSPKGLGDDL